MFMNSPLDVIWCLDIYLKGDRLIPAQHPRNRLACRSIPQWRVFKGENEFTDSIAHECYVEKRCLGYIPQNKRWM